MGRLEAYLHQPPGARLWQSVTRRICGRLVEGEGLIPNYRTPITIT